MDIDVIIPNLDKEDTIGKTIKSLEKQTLPRDYRMNILVVDGFSSDRSIEIARKASVKLIRNRDRPGPGFARNLGVRKTCGDILIFIDSDVWIEGDFLKEMLKHLDNNTVVFPTVTLENGEIYSPLKGESYISNSSFFLMKREAFEKVWFDEKYRYSEDRDFFLRCQLSGLKSKHINRKAIHSIRLKENDENKYGSEVHGVVYGWKKFKGLDDYFSINTITKLFLAALFNYNYYYYERDTSTTKTIKLLFSEHKRFNTSRKNLLKIFFRNFNKT